MQFDLSLADKENIMLIEKPLTVFGKIKYSDFVRLIPMRYTIRYDKDKIIITVFGKCCGMT